MCGRCRHVEAMNLQLSSSVARNVTTLSESTRKRCAFQGNILTLAVKLREKGLSRVYLKTLIRALNDIGCHANLNDSSEVLAYIAKKKVKDSYKANLCDFYQHYTDFYRISFSKPKYNRDHKTPNVPTKENINIIISHASKKYALIYSIIRDTGLRPVEVSNLTPDDIDLEKGSINIETAKHGKPRIVRVKNQTLAMLKEYLQGHSFELDAKIFPSSNVISNTYCRLRTSIAKKLKNPQIRKIRLYDLRHFFATYLYHRTKDILLTKEMLGHRNIQNTLVYTHLVDFGEDDSYNSATAKNIGEAKKLIEAGFEYVTEMDGVKLFRKRK
jgi:integrase